MDNENRWYFSKESLENTPSRQCGIDPSKEISYRQQAANFIQDMGQRLHVTQLCINTAIVYMHRFYMFHSFTTRNRNQIAVAALFLAAKVEEQPRKLEHAVRVAHKCLNRGQDLDLKTEAYLQKSGELVYYENMMLQTLGFDIAIDHPHTYVVKLLQLVKATKELAQTSYFMATNSLHLTTMCLQYKPTVVACVCINIACKWSDWKIEPSSEGKEWWYYVDKTVTPELIEELTKDFILVLEKSPNRLRRRVFPGNKDSQSSQAEFRAGDDLSNHMENLTYDNCLDPVRESSPIPSTYASSSSATAVVVKEEKIEKLPESSSSAEAAQNALPAVPVPQVQTVKPKVEPHHSISLAVYREKKEKERLSDQKPNVPAPIELPLPPIARHVPHHNKHSNSSKEKTLSKPDALFNELVPQKPQPTKSNAINMSSATVETTSSDKVNHQIKKLTMPLSSVLPSPASVAVPPTSAPLPPTKLPSNSVHVSKNALPKARAELVRALADHNKANDPVVLLTRLDQMPASKKATDVKVMQPAQFAKATVKNSSLDVRSIADVQSQVESQVVPTSACDTVRNVVTKVSDTNLMPTRHKHSKQKVHSLQNSHVDAQLLTQGNTQNPSPVWDVGQANGSNVPDMRTVNNRMPPHAAAPVEPKTVDKSDVQMKNEKREKHKHKHSVHSSKEKNSNHVLEAPPPEGLKITIPMEKILLRGSQKANTSRSPLPEPEPEPEPPRQSLKMKLPKPKNFEPNPLKLVITKDKNAGSYSASHKAERTSRRRERSPSSRDHNSRPVKQHKANHSQVDKIPAKADKPNNVAWNADSSYNQNNNAQQPYVMQQMYYQQPYFNYQMPTGNMQYGHMQPLPPPPPPPLPPGIPSSAASAPPLPRDPPPPLPPQPPLPTE